MELESVENTEMPYKIAVGGTIIQCERADEVLAIAKMLSASDYSRDSPTSEQQHGA
jgi:hypothetical protein